MSIYLKLNFFIHITLQKILLLINGKRHFTSWKIGPTRSHQEESPGGRLSCGIIVSGLRDGGGRPEMERREGLCSNGEENQKDT